MWSRMQRGRRAGSRGAAAPTVFVVSGEQGAQQVFTHRADAYDYARDIPGSRVSVHRLRRTLDEAVTVLDRHVIIAADGQITDDRTARLRHFDDDAALALGGAVPDADVEWFHDERADVWHIAGFGTNEEQLAAAIRGAVQRVRRENARARV